MSEQIRCPFCESAIPREALFCSRCGGKLPRTQATAPGIAPQAVTPPAQVTPSGAPSAPAPAPGEPEDTSRPAGGTSGAAAGPRPSMSSPSMSTATSQAMSVSQIQRGGRGGRIALVLAGAAVCIAGGWALGSRRDEPIAAVPAPALVELGQPRVAVGADLPDPSNFLDPTPVAPGTKVGDPAGRRPEAPGGRRTNGAGGTPPPGTPGAPAGPAPTPAGGAEGPGGAAPPPGGAPPAPGGNPPAPGGNPPDPPTPAPPATDPPAAEPDEPDVPEGQLDTRAVIFVVRHYLPQVRACYERQLRNEPQLRGQITMRFAVGAGGRVVSTEVVVNSTGSDALAACVSANLRTWRFPEPEGGAVAFEYPFRFGRQDALPELPGATQDP